MTESQIIKERTRLLSKIKSCKITQVDLAEKSGIQRTHISKILTGKHKVELDTFIKLTHACGLKINIEKKTVRQTKRE